jgi:SpoVR like protein
MNPWDLAEMPAPARLHTSIAPERPWPKLVSRPAVPMPTPGTTRAAAPIAVGTEWTVPLLERFDVALAAHAGRLQLDTYPIQYEVITAAQMIDLCSTVGMPVHYLEFRQAPARPGAHVQEGNERAGL